MPVLCVAKGAKIDVHCRNMLGSTQLNVAFPVTSVENVFTVVHDSKGGHPYNPRNLLFYVLLFHLCFPSYDAGVAFSVPYFV